MGAACGPTDESQAEPRVRHLASLTRLHRAVGMMLQLRGPAPWQPAIMHAPRDHATMHGTEDYMFEALWEEEAWDHSDAY